MIRKLKKETKELERRNIIKERPPKTSKYIRICGKSLREIAAIFDVSKTSVHNWLHDPVKKKWLEEKLREMDEENN